MDTYINTGTNHKQLRIKQKITLKTDYLMLPE